MPDAYDSDGYGIDINPSMYGIRDPQGTPSTVGCEIDPIGPWLVNIEQTHHQIHEGEAFYYHDVITLGSAATQDYLLTVPAGAYPHFDYSVEALYGITIELYEGTGKTQSASAAATFNRNRNSARTSALTVKKGTNGGAGDGTRILWRKSGSGTAQGRVAGSESEHRERVLKADTAYIFRITSAAASNDVSIEMRWYEEGA